MKTIWTGIKIGFSALGGFLGWYLGGMDGFLYALIAFVLVDYITGVMCAIADKKLSQFGWLQGHLPKGAYLCAGGHRQSGGCVCAGTGRCFKDCGDFLLPLE